MKIHLGIFASGSGTNAENLIHYFQSHPHYLVRAIFCNNPNAGVIERAKKLGVEIILFDRVAFQSSDFLFTLKSRKIEFIVLAGFLWKVPKYLIDAFPDKMINLHPALLPKYGGKGMYGDHVHHAVIANHDDASGITVHIVNEEFDKGPILEQKRCSVAPGETPHSLAKKIHQLEYEYLPQITERYLNQLFKK